MDQVLNNEFNSLIKKFNIQKCRNSVSCNEKEPFLMLSDYKKDNRHTFFYYCFDCSTLTIHVFKIDENGAKSPVL